MSRKLKPNYYLDSCHTISPWAMNIKVTGGMRQHALTSTITHQNVLVNLINYWINNFHQAYNVSGTGSKMIFLPLRSLNDVIHQYRFCATVSSCSLQISVSEEHLPCDFLLHDAETNRHFLLPSYTISLRRFTCC
jgi:hypothetical protein